MSFILCLETSTTVCSVALFKNNQLIDYKEVNNGYTHAENLHVFIQDVLGNARIKPNQLNAIAVGKGPGSYTGLRIGVSAAKGMAYALSLPLISMNSLQNLVAGLSTSAYKQNTVFVSMMDARRMEVYMCIYEKNGNEIEPSSSFIINENSLKEKFLKYDKIYFLGDGAEKCSAYLHLLPDAEIIPNQMPSALNMGNFCYDAFVNKSFENTAYFEPFYLKEFFTGK